MVWPYLVYDVAFLSFPPCFFLFFQVMKNLGAILTAAGSSWAKVVKVRGSSAAGMRDCEPSTGGT